jgi:hypothetical protein
MFSVSPHCARTALTFALLVAVSPASSHSPVPMSGIRSALELVSKQPGRPVRPDALH